MNKQNSNLIRVISMGVVVLIIFSLALFWGRFYCWAMLIEYMPEQFLSLTVRPSGLVPGEPLARQSQTLNQGEYSSPGPNDLNYQFSQIYASRSRGIIIGSAFGALWDITEQLFPYHDANDRICYNYGGKDIKRIVCLDNRSGLITRFDIPDPNNKNLSKDTELFAGPNGISDKADSSLGRFSEPIIIEGFNSNRIGLYDRGTHRFYVIDFSGGAVIKGLQLAPQDSREPIAIYGTAGIEKWFNNEAFSISFSGPQVWNAEKKKWENEKISLTGGVPSDEGYKIMAYFYYTPLLDKTGRIHIYDTDQQKLIPAGYLPAPMSLFSIAGWLPGEIAKPGNVLAYEILPVFAVRRLPGDADKPEGNLETKYLGMIASCVSREGTAMSVTVFDPNGKLVSRGDTISNDISTAEAIYDTGDGSPMMTTILFLLENLQPPVLELASYLCGDRIEARTGHRALFILPNSFIGILGRGGMVNFAAKQFVALLLMLPSLILAVWLAFRVRKDAILMGLSGTAKKWWIIGTIAFGLPAYITYRLTRPKETLVSCQNCGKMRRPDMETCHRCGSKWEVPELTPPNWRISD